MEFDGGSDNADRVSYSEKVKINIGDWEHREYFFGYSTAIREEETFEDARKRVVTAVRKCLRPKEKKTRKLTQHFTDFDTMTKLED
jgi:broad specificity phosphatase PhoE